MTTGLYGAPESFGDFVRKAHAMDYDGTRAMFEAFRCHVPHGTGIVQWMLNSAWPSLYWQLYDWYLVPTAGFFGTKKACAPLQLVYNYADHNVWAVNDAREDTDLTAKMTVYAPDSKVLRSEEKACTLALREPAVVFRNIQGPWFLAVELRDGEGRLVADNFYCISEKANRYEWEKSNWFITPISEYADLRFVSALPEAKLDLTVRPTDKGFGIRIENKSEVIAYQNILKAKAADGTLIPGVLWSDNFFSLTPGESREIECTLPAGSGPATISLSGWNGVASE